MSIVLRLATTADLEPVKIVESKATPGLRYLGEVFADWVADTDGEFLVAERQGEIVAVGKFSLMPDGSAWLEALRVIPECQGLGIGKLFYERFFEIAERKGVEVMRMYTNIGNAASKGLAERYGFSLAGTYRGMGLPMAGRDSRSAASNFTQVTDAARASELIMPYGESWEGFLVMNRTFCALTPALCAAWASEGKVYEHQKSNSLIVMGARFMPEAALHIACFGGDADACLDFAEAKAAELGVPKIVCMFPPAQQEIQQLLAERGYEQESYDCIVMEVRSV